MKSRFSLIVLLSLLPFVTCAQFAFSVSERLRSLRMEVNGEWNAMPVVQLDGDDVISFSFDEMSHEYNRFIYRITH